MTTSILLNIVADTNDADYVTEESTIDEADLEVVRKVCMVLSEGRRLHNWGVGEYCDEEDHPSALYKDLLTEDEIDIFNEFIPWGEYGIHTITQVQLRKIEVLEDLF